jgi:hypothetical protein
MQRESDVVDNNFIYLRIPQQETAIIILAD